MFLDLAALTRGDFIPVIESLPEMVWLGDTEGQCVYLNKALREFWGVDIADLPRFSWSSTLLQEDADALFRIYKEAMAKRVPFAVRARYRRADGVIRVLQTDARPRFAPNGEFLGMVGVNADVTENKTLR